MELNGIFRCAHWIYSGAGLPFGLSDVAELTHQIIAGQIAPVRNSQAGSGDGIARELADSIACLLARQAGGQGDVPSTTTVHRISDDAGRSGGCRKGPHRPPVPAAAPKARQGFPRVCRRWRVAEGGDEIIERRRRVLTRPMAISAASASAGNRNHTNRKSREDSAPARRVAQLLAGIASARSPKRGRTFHERTRSRATRVVSTTTPDLTGKRCCNSGAVYGVL